MLCLSGDLRYTNHLGAVHASALLALAEAASGDYLIRELGGVGFEVLPVVRRLEAKFRKPAFGAVFSKMNVRPAEKDAFTSMLKSRGRALLGIPVDVHDENGAHVLCRCRRVVRREKRMKMPNQEE